MAPHSTRGRRSGTPAERLSPEILEPAVHDSRYHQVLEEIQAIERARQANQIHLQLERQEDILLGFITPEEIAEEAAAGGTISDPARSVEREVPRGRARHRTPPRVRARLRTPPRSSESETRSPSSSRTPTQRDYPARYSGDNTSNQQITASNQNSTSGTLNRRTTASNQISTVNTLSQRTTANDQDGTNRTEARNRPPTPAQRRGTWAMAASMSPSTSPRLPSPPPFPEVKIGPQSPAMNATQGIARLEPEAAATLDSAATRRIRRGTKAADMASGPALIPLAELDSPFQLQEHLKALYHHHTNGPTPDTKVAINSETARQIAQPPEGVDRSLWLYELCRLLVQKANELIVGLFSETPSCSAQTCPEMRASEWQYLCAVHDPPKSCCAIDYCCHTLDWAANILTSQKHFPSRLSLGGDGPVASQQAERQITNIFRRVYRIFAHAWFQHRQLFWKVENQQGLYVLFKTVCDVYALIEKENYTISPEAEGIVTSAKEQPAVPKILKKQPEEVEQKGEGEDVTTSISTGATAKRHKHTPSTGAAVPTITEGDDEDNESIVTSVQESQASANMEQDDIDDVTISEPILPKLATENPEETDQVSAPVKEEKAT